MPLQAWLSLAFFREPVRVPRSLYNNLRLGPFGAPAVERQPYLDAHRASFPAPGITFMGLIDGFTEAMFLRDADGRAVLRPFGRFGAAVVVSAEQEAVLKRRLTWFWGVYFVILMATVLLGGLSGLLALVVVATVAHSLLIWGFMRRLPRTDQIPAISRRAALQRTSVATGRPLLWATLIGSLLFVVAGTWLVTLGQFCRLDERRLLWPRHRFQRRAASRGLPWQFKGAT